MLQTTTDHNDNRILAKINTAIKVGKIKYAGFPGGAVDKNLPANAGDTGSIPGPGRSHVLWSN